jgi:hypothetical protein
LVVLGGYRNGLPDQGKTIAAVDESPFPRRCDQPILGVLPLQTSGTSAMTPTKSIDKTNSLKGAVPDPTIWTFVHAAVVANLVVATLVLVAFTALALDVHRGLLLLGLLIIPFVTLVVWSSAAVLYLEYRAAGLLRTLKRRIRHARSSPSGKSGIWDDWLDIAEPHHR